MLVCASLKRIGGPSKQFRNRTNALLKSSQLDYLRHEERYRDSYLDLVLALLKIIKYVSKSLELISFRLHVFRAILTFSLFQPILPTYLLYTYAPLTPKQ